MEVIGVDLGGTRMRAGVVDEEGRVRGFQERPTLSSRPRREILDDLVDLIRTAEAAAGAQGLSVGLGVPTTVGPGGVLAPCPNLPTFGSVALNRELAPLLGRTPVLGNDARCFAFGEWKWGAGRGTTSMVGVTLGTSIGLATVLDGRLLGGVSNEAGEVFRAPIHLTGAPDTLHDVLSGEGVVRAYGSPGVTAAKVVADRARAGEVRAAAVFAGYGQVLAGALRWACDMVDPELIVIGGSVAGSWDLIGPPVEEALRGRRNRVVLAALGDQGAILDRKSVV